MLVRNLRKMETIVRKNKNLIWDGYDVIILREHPNPEISVNARFVGGKWWRATAVPLTRRGWMLPNDVRKV